MPSSQIERKLAAIMFTDIAGYTALSAKDSTKASKLLKTQKDTLKPIVEKYGGSWMKEIGDGLLLTFDSATSAVECSIAIQETTKDLEDLNLRIGIHEGEVIKQDGDVIGDDVNVASRIEPFSAVGGVAISQKVQQAISSNQEFATKYIGKPKLKGVSQEVKVYCITSHGLPETDISKVSAKLEEESKFNIFALTGGILTAIGIAFWIAVGVFDVSFGGKAEVPSVGILMMENLGKEDEEFWSSGMTADLITKVAGAGLIRVAPLKEIRDIDSNISIQEIAKKLRVKYILTHSFLIKDDGFDLWCKLENTENGVALFSNKISEKMDMTTQMVGKLANDIVTSLKVETKQDIIAAPTVNVEAYEFYLKAKHKYEKRENMEDTKIARGMLQKAIELDYNLISAKVLLASTYEETGEYDKATEICISALKQAEKQGDKNGIARILNTIGMIYKDQGDYDKALDYFGRTLKIAEEIGDKKGMEISFNNIGTIYSNKGDLDRALEYYERSLEIKKEIGGKRGMGITLLNIGADYREKGDYDKALDYYERSLIIFEELDNKYPLCVTLSNIGHIYTNKSDYDKALEYYARALVIREDIGDNRGMGITIMNIGDVYHYQGDINKAVDYFKRSLKIFEELGTKREMAFSLTNIGWVFLHKSDYDKAIEYLDKSLNIQKEIGLGGELLLNTTTCLNLSYKYLGEKYDIDKNQGLINVTENIEFGLNYYIYKLLEDTSYLETAYNQVQKIVVTMEDGAKFLSYPIPKAIVEEWEKVK